MIGLTQLKSMCEKLDELKIGKKNLLETISLPKIGVNRWDADVINDFGKIAETFLETMELCADDKEASKEVPKSFEVFHNALYDQTEEAERKKEEEKSSNFPKDVKIFNCNFSFCYNSAITERTKSLIFSGIVGVLDKVLLKKGNIYTDDWDNILFGPSIRVTGIRFEQNGGKANIIKLEGKHKIDRSSEKVSEESLDFSKSAMYSVSRDIALPSEVERSTGAIGGRKFPFGDMEVGNSFYVPLSDYPQYKRIKKVKALSKLKANIRNSMVSAIKTKSLKSNRKFEFRNLRNQGIGVWRVK